MKTLFATTLMLLVPLSSFGMTERQAGECRPTQKMEDGMKQMSKLNPNYKMSSKDAQTIVAYTVVLAQSSKNCAEFEDHLMKILAKMAAGQLLIIEQK